MPETKDLKVVKVNKYLEIIGEEGTGNATMIHSPTKTVMRQFACVVGLEEGAWWAMEEYANLVKGIDLINWETDDRDFLYPCANFVIRFMDPVGFGSMSVEEASAKLMERTMRENF